MQLSPITSYHLRRLFRQHCDRLQPLSNEKASSADVSIDVNLETALQILSQKQAEINTIAQKLDSLVSLHQALEKQGEMYSQDLVSVEHTIFNILGFQISDISYKV